MNDHNFEKYSQDLTENALPHLNAPVKVIDALP